MNRRTNKAGFTLMEMLVALTIIAAILAMVYGSVAATTRSIDASGARMASLERACFALRLMGRQIRCAYAPDTASAARTTPNDARPAAGDNDVSLRRRPAAFRRDSRHPRGEVLSFVTNSGLGTGPSAPRGLFGVTYRYDRLASTLSVSRQDQPDTAEHRPGAGHSDLLLNNVTAIELKFYDGRRWQPAWDAAQRHGLPHAVKVEITVIDEGGRPHQFGTTIPIVQKTSPDSGDTRRTVAAGQS